MENPTVMTNVLNQFTNNKTGKEKTIVSTGLDSLFQTMVLKQQSILSVKGDHAAKDVLKGLNQFITLLKQKDSLAGGGQLPEDLQTQWQSLITRWQTFIKSASEQKLSPNLMSHQYSADETMIQKLQTLMTALKTSMGSGTHSRRDHTYLTLFKDTTQLIKKSLSFLNVTAERREGLTPDIKGSLKVFHESLSHHTNQQLVQGLNGGELNKNSFSNQSLWPTNLVQSEQHLFHTGNMTKMQQLAWHQGQVNSPPVTQQIAHRVEQLMNMGVLSMTGKGGHKFSVRLVPETLGSLQVTVTNENNTLTAKIVAQTSAAKELLNVNLTQLKQSLAMQNVNVQKIDIQIAQAENDNTDQHNQNHREDDRHGEQQQNESFDQQPHLSEDDESFDDWLTEEGDKL